MGRHTGWIALAAGIASGADVILIPEIPYDAAGVRRVVEDRCSRGKRYSVVCVAEGAAPRGGQQSIARRDATSPEPVRFGGIAQHIAEELEDMSGIESRYVVLGHVQRGGTPVAADRVLGTEFGHHAMAVLRAGKRNRMVASSGRELHDVDLAVAAAGPRRVQAGDPMIEAARGVGVSFGEP
jgi:ATP-dependent phosphofructokinase / diphosphate-dependent phosphofructokinase